MKIKKWRKIGFLYCFNREPTDFLKSCSHVRDCRPRLSETEQCFAIFGQSFSVLRESYGCRRDTYWIRTNSRSVVGSLGDATTGRECFENFKNIVLQSWVSPHTYCSHTAVLSQSHSIVLVRTDAYGNTQSRPLSLQSHCSRAQSSGSYMRTAFVLSRTDQTPCLMHAVWAGTTIFVALEQPQRTVVPLAVQFQP